MRVMKKIRNIGMMLGLIILLSSNSNAQYFYTSYGYAQDWRLPEMIDYTIYDNYYGYDIAHVQRYNTLFGYTNYNVLLHRNGLFIEVRFDRHGHIYRTIGHNYYPLMSHRCTNHCGYHHTYYQTYYPTYHHKHYVHKHRKTVYVNTHHGHGHHKSRNTYYTNVHVEKPQKSQKHYQGNQHGKRQNHSVNSRSNSSQRRSSSVIRQAQQSNRQTQNNVHSRTNNQQQRSRSVARQPQQTNRNIEHRRPQNNGNSQRVKHTNPQRTSGNSRSDNGKNMIAYKNGRSSRGH